MCNHTHNQEYFYGKTLYVAQKWTLGIWKVPARYIDSIRNQKHIFSLKKFLADWLMCVLHSKTNAIQDISIYKYMY